MIPAALLAAFVLLYLGYPTWDWYFDGLTFAMGVEGVAGGGDPAWLLHPHHLAYGPLAYGWWRLLWSIGVTVRAWLAMQWLSTACALATLAAYHRLLLRLRFEPSEAARGAVLLGCSWGFWHFGTNGDTTLPETLLLLLLLSAAVRPAPASPGTALGLGLLQGGAILVHQTAVIILPAAAWALWRRAPRRQAARVLASFGSAAAVTSIAGYAIAWPLVARNAGWRGYAGWLAGYFGADPRTGYAPGYGGWHPGNLPESARGWSECLVGPGAGNLAAGVALGFAAAALGTGWMLWRMRRSGTRAPGYPVTPLDPLALEVLTIWLASHAAFFTWWKPGHSRFWVLALPAWLIPVAKGTRFWRGRSSRGPWWSGWQAPWALAGLLGLVVGVGPFRAETSPACNRFLPVAEAIAARTPPGMTVVIGGVGAWASLKAYVPYIAGRPMLILDWQFADRTRPPPVALQALRARLESLAARGAVVVASEALAPDLDAHFLAVHGVSGAARRALFDPLRLRRVAALAPGLDLLAPSR